MSGIINKAKVAVDKAIHPDKHHDTTHTGTHTTGTHTGAHTGTHTGTTGTGLTGTGHHTTTAGPHDSNIANKADPRVDSDRDGSHIGQGAAGGALGGSHTGAHSGALDPHTRTTAGPHNSDALNKADPRVDSDRDGANFGQAGHSTGLGHNTGAGYGHSTTGHTGTTGFGGNTGSTNAGPHDSNVLNKLDPRVDSDRDGANFGQQGHTGGLTGTGHNTGAGFGSHTGSTNAGPHSTNTANKLDPRVDSDRDGANFGQAGHSTGAGLGHNTGAGYGHSTTGTGLGHNTGYGSTNAGPHDSNLANKADPRVDSDRDGSHLGQGAAGYGTTGHGTTGHGTTGHGTTGHGTTGHGTTGYGTTGHPTGAHSSSTTAGPHNSNVLNKLDPRVDSDLDGSKTVGGNKTYASTNEPFDAAHHGPSEARQILGEPDIQHPHDASDHQRRHSLAQNDARNIFK